MAATVVIATLVPILVAFLALFVYLYIHNRKRSKRQSNNNALGNLVRQALDVGLQEASRLRLQQEEFTDCGERVWFSHQIRNGQVKHWTLVTHNFRYEIRHICLHQDSKLDETDLEATCASQDGWICVGDGKAEYQFNIQPCNFDNERATVALDNFSSTQVISAFGSSLIGWTSLSKDEIDAIWISMIGKFGDYDIIWNNCQHFLRNFAWEIMDKPAENWHWFAQDASTSHRPLRQGASFGRIANIAASIERLKRIVPRCEGSSKQRLEKNIKSLEQYINRRKADWAYSKPIDLANAWDELNLGDAGENESQDASDMAECLVDVIMDAGSGGVGGDKGHSADSGHSGLGDMGGGCGGGDGGGGGGGD